MHKLFILLILTFNIGYLHAVQKNVENGDTVDAIFPVKEILEREKNIENEEKQIIKKNTTPNEAFTPLLYILGLSPELVINKDKKEKTVESEEKKEEKQIKPSVSSPRQRDTHRKRKIRERTFRDKQNQKQNQKQEKKNKRKNKRNGSCPKSFK